MEGLDDIVFDDLKIEGLDDSSCVDQEHAPVAAKKPARRRSSVARRKVRHAKRESSQSPLCELIGEASDVEEVDQTGDDSDWDVPDQEAGKADWDESDWDEKMD